MCYRRKIWSLTLLSLGVGLILSCLVSYWFVRLLLGAILVTAGLLLCGH